MKSNSHAPEQIAYLVRIFPENVLIADLVSVWKHSKWMLCTGLAVFNISEITLVVTMEKVTPQLI